MLVFSERARQRLRMASGDSGRRVPAGLPLLLHSEPLPHVSQGHTAGASRQCHAARPQPLLLLGRPGGGGRRDFPLDTVPEER